jgi:hypothetical protein
LTLVSSAGLHAPTTTNPVKIDPQPMPPDMATTLASTAIVMALPAPAPLTACDIRLEGIRRADSSGPGLDGCKEECMGSRASKMSPIACQHRSASSRSAALLARHAQNRGCLLQLATLAQDYTKQSCCISGWQRRTQVSCFDIVQIRLRVATTSSIQAQHSIKL